MSRSAAVNRLAKAICCPTGKCVGVDSMIGRCAKCSKVDEVDAVLTQIRKFRDFLPPDDRVTWKRLLNAVLEE